MTPSHFSHILEGFKAVARKAKEATHARWKTKPPMPNPLPMQIKAPSPKDPQEAKEYRVLKGFVEAYSGGSTPPLLVFGDSVFLRVATDDQSPQSLGEIIGTRYQGGVFQVLGSGYHPGVFEQFSAVLATLPARPRLAVLPINLRSFSPIWDLNPLYRFRSEIGLLSAFDVNKPEYGLRDADICSELEIRSAPLLSAHGGIATLGDFLDITGQVQTIGSEEWKRRLETIFRYHYTPPVSFTHRKIQNLKHAIKLLNGLGVAVYCYITPLNYEAGMEYCGESFIKAVEKNVSIIQKEIKPDMSASHTDKDALMFRLDDFKFQFARNVFFTRHNATEHLRFEGRNFLAQRIIEAVQRMCPPLNSV